MDTTSNEPRKCCVCSSVLIPGDNINEKVYKRNRNTCRSCSSKAQKEKRNKIDENCTTHESARWQRVGKLISDCSNRTREGRIKLTNDSSCILIQHLKEKYPVLPIVCPVYKDIDLIYSSASLTHPKRNNCISIDRIDASKGYVVGNVQIISHQANRKKTDATFTDILKLFAHSLECDKKNNNKVIKNNGFVFFSKNNMEKTNKKKEIFKKKGEGASGLVNDGQFEFGFVNGSI
jgi:hypothetical protein